MSIEFQKLEELESLGADLIQKYCIEAKVGGPFAAFVFNKNKIVGWGVNRVIAKHDPTAHAEIEAIRDAGITLQDHDLSDCCLYATGFPCPMCLSAIMWAGIKKVYYSANYKDAASIGFRDDKIFSVLRSDLNKNNSLELIEINKDEIIEKYNEFKKMKGEIY